jgi:hypothetical protein
VADLKSEMLESALAYEAYKRGGSARLVEAQSKGAEALAALQEKLDKAAPRTQQAEQKAREAETVAAERAAVSAADLQAMAARAAMLDQELAIATDTISAERQVNTDSVRRSIF